MKYHFPFYLQGQHDAQNQSEPHKSTLDLFHRNMTTIILQKIRSVSLLFSSDRGWRLFKDKCSSVQDSCGTNAEQRRNMSAEAVWPHECTCAQIKLCVNEFMLIVWC